MKMRKVWVTLVLFGLVWLLTSCATSVTRYEPIPVLFLPDSTFANQYATTGCNPETDRPVVLIRQSLLSNAEQAQRTITHEMVHAKQLLSYEGGCKALLRKYNTDPRFRFEIEAVAYCTVLVAYGEIARLEYLSALLWDVHGESFKTQASLKSRLTEVCQEVTLAEGKDWEAR